MDKCTEMTLLFIMHFNIVAKSSRIGNKYFVFRYKNFYGPKNK